MDDDAAVPKSDLERGGNKNFENLSSSTSCILRISRIIERDGIGSCAFISQSG